MRHPDIDYMLLQERRKQELADAANSRLVAEARRASMGANRAQASMTAGRVAQAAMLALAHGLSYLGSRMINLGCRMQTRYQIATRPSGSAQASPCR